MTTLAVAEEIWPLARRFAISRGARTEARVVVATLTDGPHRGRGECVPYARYGETVDSVVAALRALAPAVADGLDRPGLASRLPAGAARNALDCALWDLEAKRAGTSVWRLAGLPAPGPVETAFTLSLAEEADMADQARRNADRPLLKLKLTGDGDLERVRAVRAAAPDAKLVVDANEGWSREHYQRFAALFVELGVALIEQPFPAAEDGMLADLARPVPVCADESCHLAADLEGLANRYDMVNLKLDKTGGLTEALALRAEARRLGLGVMVGCMVGTSLAMAPAVLLAGDADIVDLDGPLLLAKDRQPGLRFEGSVMMPPEPTLWG